MEIRLFSIQLDCGQLFHSKEDLLLLKDEIIGFNLHILPLNFSSELDLKHVMIQRLDKNAAQTYFKGFKLGFILSKSVT